MSVPVTGREFCLVDHLGNTRAKITLDPNGSPVVEVYDLSGKMTRRIPLDQALSRPEQSGKKPLPSVSRASDKESIFDWHHKVALEVQSSLSKTNVGAYKLFIDFQDNFHLANAKYLNEVLDISGEIVDVQIRDFGDIHIGLKGISGFYPEVICYFTEDMAASVSQLRSGQKIKLKGKCTEYVNKRVKIWGCSIIGSNY